MWTQVVGKTLLASPSQNHWWHTALRVSARGLATPFPILAGERSFEVELDLVEHLLWVRSDRRTIFTPLGPRTVRSFYREYLELVRAVGGEAHLWTRPVEVPDPVDFDRDEVHRDYDPVAANRFFAVLLRCQDVFRGLADSFLGKQSPVQFWWGSFDLATSRFSGRRAPERPGADRITREGYSHELVAFGFWPGGALPGGASVDEPLFYAYAAPEPEGFSRAVVGPNGARYDERLHEFVLPYQTVRCAPDPVAALREFCEGTYRAGAALGKWDRDVLERR